MVVGEGPWVAKLSALLLLPPSWLPGSGVDADDLSLSLSPPVAAGNELLVVAAATTDVGGTEFKSPSCRIKFTYVLTNPVELNFGRQMGSHDAEAEFP